MTFTPSILFEDNHCLALLKPAGIPTQAPEPFPSLESFARDYLKTTYQKLGRPYLGIPHRLDRPVSGCLLFTRSSKAAARMAEQFRERTIRKTYLALVQGSLPVELAAPGMATWNDFMRKLPGIPKGEICSPSDPQAREASLSVRVAGQSGDLTMLEISLHTGRMHQIRLQASSRGIPIAGDALYDSKFQVEGCPDHGILLHAWRLEFLHPIRYEPILVQAPLPSYWPDWASEAMKG